MKYRARTYYSAKRKAWMWDRWGVVAHSQNAMVPGNQGACVCYGYPGYNSCITNRTPQCETD
jgi:hypothetical protein